MEVHVRVLALTAVLCGCVCFADENKSLDESLQNMKETMKSLENVTEQFLAVDYEAARRSMKTFNSAGHSKAKLTAASDLAIVGAKVFSAKDRKYQFTPQERKILKEAQTYVTALDKDVEKFEAGLTQEEITIVTQDNPNSIFRVIKRLQIARAPKCTKKEYEALKAKVGEADLTKKGTQVMALAGLYEDLHVPKYLARMITLLEEPKYAKVKARLTPYFEAVNENYPAAEEHKERIARYENELVEAGVPRDKVGKYVVDMATLSPECLSRINIPFVKLQRREPRE
jgi:hypothetical protein